MKNTFYFNTGVKPWNSPYMGPGYIYVNGERHIPFECENVPEGAQFKFASPYLLEEYQKYPNYFIAEIVGGGMTGSKYAYFLI